MKLTRLSTGVMAGVLAMAAACGSDDTAEGPDELSHLVIAPQNQNVLEGQSLQLNATAIWTPSHRSENVTFSAQWESSDPSIASFEGARLVTEGPGEVVITARFGGLSASTSVFIDAAVQEILVSPAVLTLAAGTGGSADATGVASDGSKRSVNTAVAWASSNQSVATVDTAGRITARAAGTSTISASQGGSQVGTVEVTVTDAGIDDLSIAIGNNSMLPGTAQGIAVRAELADGNVVSLPLAWAAEHSPADPESEGDVVGFSGGALVALQPGTATFEGSFARGGDTLGTSNSLTVEVLGDDLVPSAITVLAPGSVSTQGQAFGLAASGDFGSAGTFIINSLIFWQGNDDTVLRLRGAQATPRSAGSVTVNAVWPVQGGDPIVGQHDITVVENAPSSVTVEAGGVGRASATAAFGSGTNQNVTAAALWSSDNACAFVDNAPARSGVVTLLSEPCAAVISASYRGQSGSISVADITFEEEDDDGDNGDNGEE
jgi:trimeric autotransporter adhesin